MTATRLAAIPHLADEAIATWGSNPISGERGGSARGPNVRTAGEMPDYVLADLDRMLVLNSANDHDGLGVLATWVRHIAGELDEQGLSVEMPHDGVGEVCQWLAERLPWVEANPMLTEDIHDDIRRLWTALRVICRVRPEYTPRCRKCSDRVILVDTTGRQTTPEEYSYGACAGCGATYPKGPAMDALGQLQEFTLNELSARVHVPLKTLHRWHQQKLFNPTETSRRRDRTFKLDDVMRVVEMQGRRAE